MTVLALVLFINAVLHSAVIYRYGTGDNNMPFLIFGIIDLVLAVAVFLSWPYAIWATLVLSVVGLVGLTVTFNKPQREKTLDRIIWAIDAAVILVAAYFLLFAGGGAVPPVV